MASLHPPISQPRTATAASPRIHQHNDTAAIERLARQELGLVKEGELVFQFVHPADTNQIPTE